MAERIGFIGAGNLASGLAMALHARGYEITAVASRTAASARRLADLIPGMTPLPSAAEVAAASDIVFVATSDAAIEDVARSVRWRPTHGVVHCSGALSLEALASAASEGASVASFHPLQNLACIDSPQEAAERLSGICYALEGDGWLCDWLEKVACDLGGQAIRVAPEDRPPSTTKPRCSPAAMSPLCWTLLKACGLTLVSLLTKREEPSHPWPLPQSQTLVALVLTPA